MTHYAAAVQCPISAVEGCGRRLQTRACLRQCCLAQLTSQAAALPCMPACGCERMSKSSNQVSEWGQWEAASQLTLQQATEESGVEEQEP